jgi:hypothetical protein
MFSTFIYYIVCFKCSVHVYIQIMLTLYLNISNYSSPHPGWSYFGDFDHDTMHGFGTCDYHNGISYKGALCVYVCSVW